MNEHIKIYIVEDEVIIAMDLKRILQSKCYIVIKVDISGEAGNRNRL